MVVSLAERFWSKVDVSAERGACWLWTASKTNRGYGYLWHDGRLQLAHRIAYELTHGTIPAGLVIDHLCRNPSCVRASHLEAVTQAVNTLRGIVGRLHGNSKKTHCNAGHLLEGDNLRPDPRGRRQCRLCAQDRDRARRARAALLKASAPQLPDVADAETEGR